MEINSREVYPDRYDSYWIIASKHRPNRELWLSSCLYQRREDGSVDIWAYSPETDCRRGYNGETLYLQAVLTPEGITPLPPSDGVDLIGKKFFIWPIGGREDIEYQVDSYGPPGCMRCQCLDDRLLHKPSLESWKIADIRAAIAANEQGGYA